MLVLCSLRSFAAIDLKARGRRLTDYSRSSWLDDKRVALTTDFADGHRRIREPFVGCGSAVICDAIKWPRKIIEFAKTGKELSGQCMLYFFNHE